MENKICQELVQWYGTYPSMIWFQVQSSPLFAQGGIIRSNTLEKQNMVSSLSLRSDFVPSNDKHNLPAPWINKAGPAGIHNDAVTVLSTKSDRQVFKGRMTCIFQNCMEMGGRKTGIDCLCRTHGKEEEHVRDGLSIQNHCTPLKHTKMTKGFIYMEN